MNAYISGVIAAVVLTSLICIVAPEGKTGKFVQGIFSLVCVLTIISPVFGLFGKETQISVIFAQSEIPLQYDYLDYVLDRKNESLVRDCLAIVEKNGISGATAVIDAEYVNNALVIKKVSINLGKRSSSDDGGHIDISTVIRSQIAAYLMIAGEQIEIYGE